MLPRRRTVAEWQIALGAQVRSARIDADIDQERLAELADVSRSAVRSLEGGRGSSLQTLIKVVRALGLTAWLEGLAPEVSVSPIRLLESGGRHRTRQRVSRPRRPPAPPEGGDR